MSTKRTYQPSKTRRIRVSGYRARAKSRSGKKVISRRQRKGRRIIAHS
ncbi:MAG: 50S ribosomal protein L34 [Candidatus Blackburnbacteria bacterium]|nr:50S ribosomal protein L34 [Candidatus Blackburnbacteria bacterium]